MTIPAPKIPFRHRPIFTREVVLWTMLGTLSSCYLGALFLAPELLDDLKPNSATLDPQSNQGQRAAARLAFEINGLRDSVSRIQMDLAQVKTDVQGMAERDKALTTQVSALEQKLSPAADTKIETANPRNADPKAHPAKPGAAAPEQIQADATRPPAPASAPTLINADSSASMTTGQIIDPANGPQPAAATNSASSDGISFGPAVVKTAAKPHGLKLASGASVEALRLSWSLLAERHGDALKNLQARYVTGGDPQNPSYELIAGPVKSNAEAKRVCKALAASNIACSIGDFAGESL